MWFQILPFFTTTLSLIFSCFLGVSGIADDIEFYQDALVIDTTFNSSFQFGGFVYVGPEQYGNPDREWIIKHEFGHYKQEQLLKGGYLFVVGIPSIIQGLRATNLTDYLNSWPEQWATELGK